jgi:tRNA threonylcarbamoyladenosine biosynthesis protein TsaB
VIILAIDTSGQRGGVALARDGVLVEEITIHTPDGFGHHLFGVMNSLLTRHALTAPAVDCFAAASGPGSFTGIRVSLAAVKGLAEATGRAAVGISNLRALAFHGTTNLRAPFIDARREEIYGGLYDTTLRAMAIEAVSPLESWLASLPAGAIEFISSDMAPFREVIEAARPGSQFTTAPACLASAIAAIAFETREEWRSADSAAIDANYVRRSDAELNWREA